jgi:Major Facilitator Superfamily
MATSRESWALTCTTNERQHTGHRRPRNFAAGRATSPPAAQFRRRLRNFAEPGGRSGPVRFRRPRTGAMARYPHQSAPTFTDPKERGKAFGVYGAVAASGSALGLLLGGALTSYLSWRWCLYINLVFAAIGLIGGALLLGRHPRTPGARLDMPGVAAVSGGMFCLVYGFSNASVHGWHSASTWGFLAAGAALLIVFTARQSREPGARKAPWSPPRTPYRS